MSVQDTNPIISTESDAIQEAPSSVQNGFISLMPMLLIFVVFYFLLIRPQDKKRRAQEALVSGVKKGDEVITHSGVYGIVSKLNDSDGTVELTIAKDVVIKVLKTAIADMANHKQIVRPKALEKKNK